MEVYTVSRKQQPLAGTVTLPTSKSISNRLLIIRALCETEILPSNLSTAEDTILMKELLELASGIRHHCHCEKQSDVATGLAQSNSTNPVVLSTGNAGTVMRFLTAYLATKPGSWLLSGSDRMLHRPVGILVEALKSLGASVEYTGKPGYPPLLIRGKRLRGGEVTVDVSVSSQFVSALLLIAPVMPEGLVLHMTGEKVSFPYVEMTLRMMEDFGVKIGRHDKTVIVNPGGYLPASATPKPYDVEADWSSAAFWYETAALAPSAEIRIRGLGKNSLQGDAVLAELFRPLGVETVFEEEGILLKKFKETSSLLPPPSSLDLSSTLDPNPPTINLSAVPDLAPSLIVTYAALGISVRFTGLHHLKIKESNRLEALITELKRLGITIRHPATPEQGLRGVYPAISGASASGIIESDASTPLMPALSNPSGVLIETSNDHRIAMAFAPLALFTGTLRIANPSVVAKSYPGFWEEMTRLGFEIRGTRDDLLR